MCNDNEQTTINISKKCDGTNDCPVPPFDLPDYVADDETSYTCAGPGKYTLSWLSKHWYLHLCKRCKDW